VEIAERGVCVPLKFLMFDVKIFPIEAFALNYVLEVKLATGQASFYSVGLIFLVWYNTWEHTVGLYGGDANLAVFG